MPFPFTLPVLVVPNDVTFGDTPHPHRDWAQGLNEGHALWAARQAYPESKVFVADNLRWTGATLSECVYGCKIRREDSTGAGYREICHSATYGCPLGREDATTYESDHERVYTPGGDCTYCASPAMISMDHGWICSYTCV